MVVHKKNQLSYTAKKTKFKRTSAKQMVLFNICVIRQNLYKACAELMLQQIMKTLKLRRTCFSVCMINLIEFNILDSNVKILAV